MRERKKEKEKITDKLNYLIKTSRIMKSNPFLPSLPPFPWRAAHPPHTSGLYWSHDSPNNFFNNKALSGPHVRLGVIQNYTHSIKTTPSALTFPWSPSWRVFFLHIFPAVNTKEKETGGVSPYENNFINESRNARRGFALWQGISMCYSGSLSHTCPAKGVERFILRSARCGN